MSVGFITGDRHGQSGADTMDLPNGYEPFRINTCANDTVAGILCRRPDGGVSDVRVVLPKPTQTGTCPACGRDMVQRNAGLYTCSTGHVLTIQTTEVATRRFVGSAGKQPKREPVKQNRVVRHVPRSGAFPARNTTQRRDVRDMSDDDIRAVVEQAMKEAGL